MSKEKNNNVKNNDVASNETPLNLKKMIPIHFHSGYHYQKSKNKKQQL